MSQEVETEQYTEEDIRRFLDAATRLSDVAEYRLAYAAGSVNPCPFEGGCNLSAEEHHRLAYGILAVNKAQSRRIQELENGGGEDGRTE